MRKDFNNNPAFDMLSGYTANENENAENIKPIKKKETTANTPLLDTFEPTKKETKSKRLLLLVKPSTLSLLKEKARKHKVSTNDLINQILENNI